MDLDVVFAGTAGSVPSARRGLPALLLRRGGDRLLFDCGEGTQRQLVRSVGLPDLDAVFLTHSHADHWLGLPGMLKSFDLRDRERAADVFGPPGHDARCSSRCAASSAAPRYPLTITELERRRRGRVRRLRDRRPFNVRHRGTAFGYAIVEARAAGALRRRAGARARRRVRARTSAACSAARPSTACAPEQVVGPARAGRKIVLSGDTAPCDMVRAAADRRRPARPRGDVPATTTPARAQETGAQHRAPGGARSRVEAEVRLLALTHLSTRYARARDPRRGRARSSPTSSSRATSTRSRCRSPRRASRSSCADRGARRDRA